MTALTPLPEPPSTADPENFDARADAFLAALANLVAELNTIIGLTIPAGSAAANTLTGTTLAANVIIASLQNITGALDIAGVLSTPAGGNSDKGNIGAAGATTAMFTANNLGIGWYLVGAAARAGGSAYGSVALICYDGANVFRAGGFNGADSSIDVSGVSVRYNQGSGVPQNVDWFYILIGSGI